MNLPNDLPAPHSYKIEIHKQVKKFLKKHQELAKAWEEDIKLHLTVSPKQGDSIGHMKAKLHCNHRWATPQYRVLYTVFDECRVIRVFRAGNRGDVYKK